MSKYYKLHSPAFSFREYWWGARNPLVIIAWLIKLFRIQISSSIDDPCVESIREFEIFGEDLPTAVKESFKPLAQEMEAQGFCSPVYHAIADSFHSTWIYWATYQHQDGRTIGRIHLRVWKQPHPPKVHLFPIFLSALDNGAWLVSTAGKADVEAPPSHRVNRIEKAGLERLWESHLQLLERESMRNSVKLAQGPDALRAMIDRHHGEVRDFHVKRGALRPRDVDDEANAATRAELLQSSESEVSEHSGVLAELNQLEQKKKGGWGKALLILVVTIAFFIGLGAARWTWEFVLYLVPILLIHELGHFIAMRLFKYQNVRMFFIPLFGAAVSGRNYNVAGWKKAIVSLMGPLPGIALGAVLSVVGLVLQNEQVLLAAMLTLILNGFNLLPALPLDGGWVLHSVLFCRHYLLDFSFRVLAVLMLIGGGLALGDRVLMFLGVFFGIGLPVSFKLSKITAKLRQEGIAATSPDDQSIPVPVACRIASEIKAAVPKGLNNKTIAQHVAGIFESLNARPPGALASIGLLGAHFGGIVVAALFALLCVIGRTTDIGSFINAAAERPPYRVSCDGISTVRGEVSGPEPSAGRNTMVATFKDRREAEARFEETADDVTDDSMLLLFGQSVLYSFPEDDAALREELINRWDGVSEDLHVVGTNGAGQMRFSFIAPTEESARDIELELNEYLSGGWEMYLIPPWHPEDTRADTVRNAHRAARQLHLELSDIYSFVATNSSLERLSLRMARARRFNDTASIERLESEMEELRDRLYREALEAIRDGATNESMRSIIDLYEAMPDDIASFTDDTRRLVMLELGASLGQIEIDNGAPMPGADRYSASWAAVSRSGLLLTIHWISLNSISYGAPALVDWLCDKKCAEIYYDFGVGYMFSGSDFDDFEMDELE